MAYTASLVTGERDRGITVDGEHADGTQFSQYLGHGAFYGNEGLRADWALNEDGTLNVEAADAGLARRHYRRTSDWRQGDDGRWYVDVAPDRCPVCSGPIEIRQWTGARLCQQFGSDHYREERSET